MNSVLKIAVVGGESTGKSTLCAQLAEQFATVWVPEYARTYLEQLNRAYEYDDLRLMSLGQIESEKKLWPLAHKYLFCDTDMHVFKVWSEHKYGKVDEVILNLLEQVDYDAYLITSPDFPWQPDPLREHEEEKWRVHFFDKYCEAIRQKAKPYCIVRGTESERLKQAITFLDELDTNN